MITNHTIETLQAFEKEIADLFNSGKIRAPVHLESGNELELLKIFKDIKPDDWIAGSWRLHLKCLLKGVPPERLRADILAGRSITLCYPDYRIISSAIVGGILPIALGIAWAIKRNGGKDRVWAFLGDMTSVTGIAHECAQYAAGHNLPIEFVIEWNGISVCTPTEEVWGKDGECIWSMYEYKLGFPHAGAGVRVQF